MGLDVHGENGAAFVRLFLFVTLQASALTRCLRQLGERRLDGVDYPRHRGGYSRGL